MREREQVVREREPTDLPCLTVTIRENGERVKVVTIADPRQEYIEAFNERCERMGLVASLT